MVWLLDPSGSAPADGVSRTYLVSLLDRCGTWASARETGLRLVRAEREPGIALTGTDLTFESYAAELLAALLFAAAHEPARSAGSTVADVARWIAALPAGAPALTEPATLLAARGDADADAAAGALALVLDGRDNNGDTIGKLRSSVGSTLLSGAALDRLVAGDRYGGTASEDLVTSGDLLVIELTHDNPVKSRAEAALATLVEDDVVTAQRRLWRAGAVSEPLRVLYDEAANGAVNPNIPTWASTGAGDGIALLLCAQSLHQLDRVFPADGAGLVDAFTHRLFLRGHAIDGERIARLFGEFDHCRADRSLSRRAFSRSTWTRAVTTERRPRVTPDQLITLPQWCGLLACPSYCGPIRLVPPAR